MTASSPTQSTAVPIGIVGCGNIFPAYLNTLRRCRQVRIVAIADANAELAASRGAEHGVPVLSIDDLLASDAYPDAFFVARQFRFEGARLAELRGEFTLRGISQPLSLRATKFGCRGDGKSPDGAEVCGGDFEGEILRSEFGATFGLPLVANRVKLIVQVEGRRTR